MNVLNGQDSVSLQLNLISEEKNTVMHTGDIYPLSDNQSKSIKCKYLNMSPYEALMIPRLEPYSFRDGEVNLNIVTWCHKIIVCLMIYERIILGKILDTSHTISLRETVALFVTTKLSSLTVLIL